MRLCFLLALALTTAYPTVSNAFEGVLHVTASMQQMGTMQTKIFVRESGDIRVDNELPAMGMSTSVLHLKAKNQILHLMHAQKQYMEMPKRADARTPAGTPMPEFEVKRIGREKVAGFDTEHAQLVPKQGGPTMDVWVTKDQGLGAMSGLMEQDPSFDANFLAAMKKAHLDGYPVKMVVKQGGQTMSMETTKVEKKKLASDLFEVPKGYAKTTMPAMPGMTPEQMEMLKKMAEQQGAQ